MGAGARLKNYMLYIACIGICSCEWGVGGGRPPPAPLPCPRSYTTVIMSSDDYIPVLGVICTDSLRTSSPPL